MMAEVITEARPNDVIKPSVTVENRPPSDHDQHCSAWELPEVHNAVEKLDWTKVTFTSCHFQRRVELGKRTFKSQMFAGSLLGLRSLAGTSPCGKADHIPVVGKTRSVESGHYSDELCEAYAELVIHHFRRLATAEFYAKREVEPEEGGGRTTPQEHQAGEVPVVSGRLQKDQGPRPKRRRRSRQKPKAQPPPSRKQNPRRRTNTPMSTRRKMTRTRRFQ